MLEYCLSKEFARKLCIMLDTGLISHQHYSRWCDEIIETFEKPPYWIIELSLKRDVHEAYNVVCEFIYSEPCIKFKDIDDLYVACLFLSYERGKITWESFLLKAGQFTDGSDSAKHECEYFYMMLNDYENSDYLKTIEENQRKEITNEFKLEIDEISRDYSIFNKYL